MIQQFLELSKGFILDVPYLAVDMVEHRLVEKFLTYMLGEGGFEGDRRGRGRSKLGLILCEDDKKRMMEIRIGFLIVHYVLILVNKLIL